MASKYFAKGLKRSALTVALGLCFVGGVQAQTSVGSIFGDTAANSTVKVENLDTGLAREITADVSGKFTFPQLSPGRYRVTSGGVSRDVQVKVGTGSSVSLVAAPAGDATTLGTVTVVGASGFNPIDVSSVESTTVFTAEQIDELPVARDVTNVALLAPGTVRGDTGFGNLASFGGASVAENGYYVNGFDVTNIRNFTSFADIPFDAIAEQQVKTGGYGAEYGRSLGGVISIVSKRGTNEWKGGVSAYWTPSSLKEHGRDVFSRDPDVAASADPYFVYRSANESDQLSYNIYGGGPLIKDRLFVFGLIQGRKDSSDTYGQTTSLASESSEPNGMVKLDWNITDNHLLEFTGVYNKVEDEYTSYVNPNGIPTGEHGAKVADYTITNGGEVYIAKYTGYLTDNFTLSAMAGHLKIDNNFQSLLPGGECPPIYDSRDANISLNPIGCWNPAQFTIRDPAFGGGPDQDERRAYRLDAEWRVGDHNLRFGLDQEKFTSSAAGRSYSGGGNYYRYFNAGTLFGPDYAFLGDLVRVRTTFSESGSFEVINQAAYVEDNWQVTDNVLLYAGLRAETFENKNAVGQTFVESDTLLAPRLGFSWDVNGDSTFKVFGNAGRYYIPVASNTNVRGSVAEESTEVWYFLDGIDPATGLPIYDPNNVLFPLEVNGSRTAPDPRTVAANNLDPMYQDEYILGFQHQMGGNWSLGMRAIMRKVKAGMDDVCSHNGFNQWAADNGFDPNFALDGDGIDMAGCFLLNPGVDVTMALDPDNNGTLDVYTVPASYIGLPEYQRKYHAVELFWEKAKSNGWYLQGSYTLAKSKGNVEGYVNSTLEQDDAGITQDFDFPAFEDGAYGYLPNDRRHTLKLFGAYDITDEWTVSANLLVQSGRPVSCNGFIPVGALQIPGPDAGTISAYSGSSFYCLDPTGSIIDRQPGPDDLLNTADDVLTHYSLGNRGDRGRTPWTKTFDVGVGYTPNWADGKLNLQIKVFNVLNSQTVTEYNESSTSFRTQRVEDADFLNHVNYQTPRSVRFTARYDF